LIQDDHINWTCPAFALLYIAKNHVMPTDSTKTASKILSAYLLYVIWLSGYVDV